MVQSASRSSFLFEHDLFGKPDSTFPDHAPSPANTQAPAGTAAGAFFHAKTAARPPYDVDDLA
jgi:hypothetical protein